MKNDIIIFKNIDIDTFLIIVKIYLQKQTF